MRSFFREIVHALEAGQPVELVSVAASEGSTPRGAGAMMAVFPGGRTAGTIGGGNVEFACQQLAAELLEQKADALRQFRFVQGEAASLGERMAAGAASSLQGLVQGVQNLLVWVSYNLVLVLVLLVLAAAGWFGWRFVVKKRRET